MTLSSKTPAVVSRAVIETFVGALAEGDVPSAMNCVAENIHYVDTSFGKALDGKNALERRLRLAAQSGISYFGLVEKLASSSTKTGILFREEKSGKIGTAMFDVDDHGAISQVFVFQENSKDGEAAIRLLSLASKVIEWGGGNPVIESLNPVTETQPNNPRLAGAKTSTTLPEQYFEAWNDRNMTKACSLFADTVEYDDTVFPVPFRGREALENHLGNIAGSVPSSFSFVVDDKVDTGDCVFLRWHVENSAEELPFTRGCSCYEIENGKILRGTDVKEPAVFKPGSTNIVVQSVLKNIQREPIRFVPIAVWATYMYVVFFSDWFFGLPATALEQRAWEEVRDLSLNFFLVSPILHLPFAPVVHPMLEGVFNLLLSWAALFAGFLSDDRRDKPNILPMLPMVAGMQFLTSAFLLPYLALRTNEHSEMVFKEDLPVVAQVTESRMLAPFLSAVGSASIVWAFFARVDDFGGLNERLTSFMELLSVDRVGSSFLVDLVIFGLFQGWLVDDDLKRRGESPDSVLAQAAKYVPFFGMASYLALRPSLRERNAGQSSANG